MTIKLNGWTKWIVFGVTILVSLGIYIATVRSNTERIVKVEDKSHSNEGEIRDLKKDVTYIREGIDRIEKKVDK